MRVTGAEETETNPWMKRSPVPVIANRPVVR